MRLTFTFLTFLLLAPLATLHAADETGARKPMTVRLASYTALILFACHFVLLTI